MVYSPRCFCKIGTITFDFITLNARFVDYFPRITQSIKGINKKAWQFISMICKIYTTTTMNLRDITSPRWVYLISFDLILGPHGGDFDQKFFRKVKCPTYAQGTPPPHPTLGLTLIDALPENMNDNNQGSKDQK